MQKSHTTKKKLALERILARRRSEKIADDQENIFNDVGYIQLPDGILPDAIGMNELKDEQPSVTKKAYAIMEWWRCTGSTNADTGMPRYKAFWKTFKMYCTMCSFICIY